jgi:hypothetical protein
MALIETPLSLQRWRTFASGKLKFIARLTIRHL